MLYTAGIGLVAERHPEEEQENTDASGSLVGVQVSFSILHSDIGIPNYIKKLSSCLSTKRHLGCFQIWTIMNKGAINIHVQVIFLVWT